MRVRNVSTKVLSLLLAVCMVVSLMPMSVFAADGDVLEGTGSLVSVKLVENLSNGDKIIIGDGTGNYLVREGFSVKSTTVLTDATEWTVNVSNGSYTLSNDGYYLCPRNSGNNYSLTISNATQYASWSYDSAKGFSYSNRYLRYSNGWSVARNVTSGYGAAYTDGSGDAVTFKVDPGATIAPNGTQNLNPVVTVAGDTVDLSACTIDWASADENIATVQNGVVTGVADGTALITATLSDYDGTALETVIELKVTVTVQSKAVVSAVLSGNSSVTIGVGETPDFSGIALAVTYDDGNTAVITVDNGLIISGYDANTVGSYYATITYLGVEYGTVRVVVDGNPYEGLDEAPTPYPEYPADGAVRIDKTATELDFESTGVVQVELDVAGVSVKRGVDVILVADISNSMAWYVGADISLYEYQRVASSTQTDKWDALQSAAATFINTFMGDNADGSATNNTISFVTFGGYDAQRNSNRSNYSSYADSVQTVFTGYTNAQSAINIINNIEMTGTVSGTSVTYAISGMPSGNGAAQGGTNYDYAFLETAAAINQLKSDYEAANGASYDESGREIYVVFMTDGAPDHYNQLYYKTRSTSQFDYYALYNNTTDTFGAYFDATNSPPSYGNITFTQQEDTNGVRYYLPSADLSNDNWIDWIQSDSLYVAEQVMQMDSVNSITSIGFDLANGGFSSFQFSLDILESLLRNLAGENSCDVFTTSDTSALESFYAELATKIRYAGTQAQATDIIDSDFTLQMGATAGSGDYEVTLAEYGINPSITIRTYDLWTKGETDVLNQIGTRKGTYNDVEVVTFNADGTEAYSTLIDDGKTNIMSTIDGAVYIDAFYFTYTKTADGVETFNWNIGNITDKEIALIYQAYLKGSLEGEQAKGLKYTNEEAIVQYIDINGNYAVQEFPVPAVAWGGASTAYEFYLVNYDGEPCDRNGNVIPFANRIIITGPFYEELYLYSGDTEVAQEIIAEKVLPAGYTLYDNTAMYTVQTATGDNYGYLRVSDPATVDDDYEYQRYSKDENGNFVKDENGQYMAQTTIVVSAVEQYYIQSRVAFGVIYNQIPLTSQFVIAPDPVVIDYGKKIEIDVNANNDAIPEDVTATLVGFSMYYDNVDVKNQFSSTVYSSPFSGTYGTFELVDDKAVYTPEKFVSGVDQVFCVYQLVKDTDTYYMVSTLAVAPATSVYYETDFADGIFTTKQDATKVETSKDYGEEGVVNWYTSTSGSTDSFQDYRPIGAGQTYGYDTSYDDDVALSNGTSWVVEGEGYDLTYVTFSFTGTGFDLFSRTGVNQGQIKVRIYSDEQMTKLEKTVTVLNKSEANEAFELYQIPVVSVNDLPYGTYYVHVGVANGFENTLLTALNRGNQFYFDALRIYDPLVDYPTDASTLTGDAAMAHAFYAADGEADYQLQEVRQLLITAGTFSALEGQSTTGVVLVDSNMNGVEVGDYTTVGPNNEVYLAQGQSIAFAIEADAVPASIDIGAKTVTAASTADKAAEFSAVITDSATTTYSVKKEIKSNTVQFIDMMNETTAAAMEDGKAYVVITNTGSGVLSITDIKVAFSDASAPLAVPTSGTNGSGVRYIVNVETFEVAQGVILNASAEAGDPAEPTANYDILDVSMSTSGKGTTKVAVFTVITSQDVTDVVLTQNYQKVNASKVSYMDREDGTRAWSIIVTNVNANQGAFFTITGYGADGSSGKAVTVSIATGNN